MIVTRPPVRSASASSRSSSRVHATSRAADVGADAGALGVPAGVAQPLAHRAERPVAGHEARDQQHAAAVAGGDAGAAEHVRAPQLRPLQPDPALAPERRNAARSADDDQRYYRLTVHADRIRRERTRRAAASGERVQASAPCVPRPSATARSASQEHPDPEPQAGELLVRVRAAGLNGADMLQLKGGYPAPPGSPQDIPGLELAGEVVAVGRGVTRFELGDRVMAIVGGGGQARARARPRARRDAGPGRARLDGGRRRARGVHHRPRRALHAGGADRRRAPARPRRGRRRRDGRGAARRRWPARA